MTHSDNEKIDDMDASRLEGLADVYKGVVAGEIVVEGEMTDDMINELLRAINEQQDVETNIDLTPQERHQGWATRLVTDDDRIEYLAVYQQGKEEQGVGYFVTFLPPDTDAVLGLAQALFNYASRNFKKGPFEGPKMLAL